MSCLDDKIIGVTLGELRNVYEQELLGVYERSESRQHFAQLCEAYFGYQTGQE